MPELPDVETFRGLAQRRFMGATVSQVVVSDPKSLEGATEATLQRKLHGRRLLSTGRHGKYLFLSFGDDLVLVMHFGPAGALCRVHTGEDEPDYVRFMLEFSDGEVLAYVNKRRIGHVRLIENPAEFIKQMQLGPDAMDSDFGTREFAALLDGHDQPIKNLLMDQAKLSGIGNTWSDEILFQARIIPTAPAESLDADRRRRLFDAIKKVFRTAIDLDPTTDDFRDRLPPKFLLPHRQPGGHCPRCDTALERVKIGGNTATYCPHCQT